MDHRDLTDELKWTLLSRVDDQTAALITAEAGLTVVEARLATVGAGIARIRAFLAKLGIRTSDPGASRASERSYMSPKEFAALMNMSARSVRTKLDREGEVGVHYHLEGRRFCVHVAEAELLFRTGVGTRAYEDPPGENKPLIADEVTRFRARVALRKAKVS